MAFAVIVEVQKENYKNMKGGDKIDNAVIEKEVNDLKKQS